MPHRKLRIKWSGPYVFIRRINSQMTEISTLPSEKEQYKAKNFVIHFRKLRLHQRQSDQQPHADPKQIPQFSPEEQTLAKDHADSLVFESTLEHVRDRQNYLSPRPHRVHPRSQESRRSRWRGRQSSTLPTQNLSRQTDQIQPRAYKH